MSRIPIVDEHGVRHRPQCPLPGWRSGGPIGRVHVAKCAGCGVTRLITAKESA